MRHNSTLAIIGGGPAGLMAAEMAAKVGTSVTLYERMAQPGRKFMMAGRGGLNLTHSENLDAFITRYGDACENMAPIIRAFTPAMLRAWCEGLGEPCFVGSSGRVFPKSFKASPLLRAWLQRLRELGVQLATRHHWMGWREDGQLLFRNAQGETLAVKADATLLALGGASWPHLGADGGAMQHLAARGIALAPFRPANCGFAAEWSAHLLTRFEGAPLKNIALHFGPHAAEGEMVITRAGIEGGAVYALAAPLREAIAAEGSATLTLDLRKDVPLQTLAARLAEGRGSASLSTHLKRCAGLTPAGIALLQETLHAENIPPENPAALAARIKALPLRLTAPFPVTRAISSAGGVQWSEVDEHLMLKKMPGVFVAGEMLDWEAPTGGYLLQGCFSTAVAAARGAVSWRAERS